MEEYLKKLSQKDRTILYMMILIVCAFVSFYVVMPPLKALHGEELTKNRALQKEYDKYTRLSDGQEIKKRILQLKEAITLKKIKVKELNYIQEYIQFNKADMFEKNGEKRWIKYFDTIIQIAKKHALTVKKIEKSVISSERQEFSRKESFRLQVSGNFQNIMHFINQIEKEERFLLIDTLKLTQDVMEIQISTLGY
jgi:Tfp pilus assembly protein PilO